MLMFEVTDAKREQLYGSIGYVGASGAGKTLSMLKTAYGFIKKKYPELDDQKIWQKVGVIDTEHERSKIYAGTSIFGLDIGSFKHLNFAAPYSVDRLEAAIKLLVDNYGVEILIIDSLSHFWEDEGGILDEQQKFGGDFRAWREVNPTYKRFVKLITGEKYGIDMLCSMRAKTHYEVSQLETGKMQIQKMGLKPVQRDSLEYEFHIVFNIDMNHVATALKDNSGLFNVPRQIEPEVGAMLYDWLKTGVDVLAEKRAKEEAERKKKQAMVDTILAYKESTVPGMKELVEKLIVKTGKSYKGNLMNMPLERLESFVNYVHEQEQKLKKKIEKDSEEIANELKNHKPETVNPELEEKAVKDLKEVAKSFNIKGYSKMNKEELIEAIKQEQKKLESQPKVESPL